MVTTTFTTTGTSDTIAVLETCQVSLSGYGAATVNLERSFDNGSTWKVVETFSADSEKIYDNLNCGSVLLRFNCTAYTSGSILCILTI